MKERKRKRENESDERERERIAKGLYTWYMRDEARITRNANVGDSPALSEDRTTRRRSSVKSRKLCRFFDGE